MSASAIIAALWALAATATAFLPMRRQYLPGITLLCVAPVIILCLGVDYGAIVGILAALGFVSMFRNPLIYFFRGARGEKPDLPK